MGNCFTNYEEHYKQADLLGIASLILWGEATVLENIAPDV